MNPVNAPPQNLLVLREGDHLGSPCGLAALVERAVGFTLSSLVTESEFYVSSTNVPDVKIRGITVKRQGGIARIQLPEPLKPDWVKYALAGRNDPPVEEGAKWFGFAMAREPEMFHRIEGSFLRYSGTNELCLQCPDMADQVTEMSVVYLGGPVISNGHIVGLVGDRIQGSAFQFFALHGAMEKKASASELGDLRSLGNDEAVNDHRQPISASRPPFLSLLTAKDGKTILGTVLSPTIAICSSRNVKANDELVVRWLGADCANRQFMRL